MMYRTRALIFALPEINTRYDAIPISMYNSVQTIGKSHFGGDNGGLFSVLKICIFSRVRNAEIPPTIRGIAIHINNFFHSIFKKITSHYYIYDIEFICMQRKKDKNFNLLKHTSCLCHI